MATSDRQWISKQEAAERLGFGEKTIDRRRRSGELASLKSTDSQQGHVRISLASLEAYIARRRGLAEREATPRPSRLSIPALEEMRAAKAAARRASGRRSRPDAEKAA